MGFSDVLLYRKYFILCRWISCATVHTTDEPILYHNFRVNKKELSPKGYPVTGAGAACLRLIFQRELPRDCLLVIPRVALPRRNTNPRSTPRSFVTTAVLPARLPTRLVDASR